MLSIEYIALIAAVINDCFLAESQEYFVCSLSVRDTRSVNWKCRRDKVRVLWNADGGKGGRDVLGS